METRSVETGDSLRSRLVLLIAITIPAAMLFVPPIPQDPAYHVFADQRALFGIPNFWNVASNLPFLAVGLGGLWQVLRCRAPGAAPDMSVAYAGFFAGVTLVAFGSTAYHLDPRNATLVLDRLAMTITFAAFFCIVLGERLSARLATRLLWPLVAIGMLSVLYWAWTEEAGRGDLRAYAVAQFLPAILLTVILLGWPSRFDHDGPLWTALGCYLLAKISESLDARIFELTGVTGGHAVKHLLAAAGALFVCAALARRTLREEHAQAATAH